MNEQELIRTWKKEESIAHIHGWDFSHIAGRYTEETDLPWDYQRIILNRLKHQDRPSPYKQQLKPDANETGA